MKILCIASVLAFILFSCSTKKENAVKVSDIAKNYKKLKKMTKESIPVNYEIAVLCTRPGKAIIEDAVRRSGPHAMAWVHMYMNDIAAKAFTQKPYKFPEGSVIVKDKLTVSKGVGGMIKRHPGYDSKNGDWEYFYFEKPEEIDSGRIQSCIKCHSSKAHTDYVFGGWTSRQR